MRSINTDLHRAHKGESPNGKGRAITHRLVVIAVLTASALALVAPSAFAIPNEGGSAGDGDGEYVPTGGSGGGSTAALSDADDEFTSSPTFKTCHGMSTKATLFRSLNKITAHTDIWSRCWFGGFTGKAVVILADANDRTINAMSTSYGVNGMFEASMGFGPSEQKDLVWDAYFPAGEVALAKGIRVSHSYDPNNRLAEILAEAVRIARSATELVAIVKNVAHEG